MSDRTKTISIHRLRRTARARAKALQAELDIAWSVQTNRPAVGDRTHILEGRNGKRGATVTVPAWARGVRVENAGAFQHSVVVTEHRGH